MPNWLRNHLTPPPSHRLSGVREQLARAQLLLGEAHAVRAYQDAFPKLIAAVYPARAALEVMREAASRGELTVSLREFDQLVNQRVPRWRLVHAVRVRDFHHGGVQGGGRMLIQFRIHLPPHSQATISMRANPFDPRPKVRMSDPSGSYKFLLTSDVVVQDEQEQNAIPYWVLLEEYLAGMDELLVDVRTLLKVKGPTSENPAQK